MPVFTFSGTTATGQKISGERAAENKQVLSAALRRERIVPGAIKEKGKEFALPSLLAFILMMVQLSASRYIWHQASLTVGTVMERPIAWPVLALIGLAMLAVDVYCTAVAGEVNRKETEKYFDDAEYWLRSWKAPVVHFFTLGRLNPRQMVAAEVQKALLEASASINSSMWWVTAQVGLRIAFGLTLWVTYAVVLA